VAPSVTRAAGIDPAQLEDRRLATAFLELATLLYQKADYAGVEEVYDELFLDGFERLPPEMQIRAHIGFGETLVRLGRFEEAESFLVTASERSTNLRRGAPHESRLAAAMVDFYESWDAARGTDLHAEQAALWRERLQNRAAIDRSGS
jgi:hypothetical protein